MTTTTGSCRRRHRAHRRRRPSQRVSSSASVRPASAVIRSREMPSGTDGGRKQPTRTPSSRGRGLRRERLARAGIGTDSTAPAGGVDAERAGRARRDPARARRGQLGLGAQRRRARPAPRRPRRGEAGVEDERPRAVDQVLDHGGAAEHRAALAAERLGQRGGDDDVGRAGEAGSCDQAAPAVPATPSPCASSTSRIASYAAHTRGQLGQRRRVAEHGVDRLDQHQRPRLGALAPAPVATAATSLCGTTAPRPASSRQASTSEACTCASETSRRVAVGQRGDRREVGVVAGGEHQRGRLAQ